MQDPSAAVAAIVRRLPSLSQLELAELHAALVDFMTDPPAAVLAANRKALVRREALKAIEAVARRLDLSEGAAPTTTQFKEVAKDVAPEWDIARVIRTFGSWTAASAAFTGTETLTPVQASRLRAARKGVFRDRDDYITGVRAWLDSGPSSETTNDYDGWVSDHNQHLPEGAQPLVSYSMLRKALPWTWSTVKEVARGSVTTAEAPTRKRAARPELHGPDDLVGLAVVMQILELSKTAARNLTYSKSFPAPAYIQRSKPGIRLWRRADIEHFAATGENTGTSRGVLQGDYLDAAQVAEQLGLAAITVTTGSSPRVPQPAVRTAGLQLWHRADLAG